MPADNKTPAEYFGENVFNESVMGERMPIETYAALKLIIDGRLPLDAEVAHIAAKAMRDWAVEKGATHYTHWFQPMTGITAEKHDAFIAPAGGGRAVMEFSGRELMKGEPDASSLPNGGLRATFEARGYTAWDPTSYAFIKDGTLYIPTAFYSYSGEALDNKTPLLRSMDALNRQALRVLAALGRPSKHVSATCGPEQEYFLIDKGLYDKRKDLLITGRTLFGARPPKGQEMDDHYYGNLKGRVLAFMKELDGELWKLGVYAKTRHNESAPAQHELAPVFTTVNIAADHNQLTMEMMKKIAPRHGLVCLLHEKPFEGVNGSGKHNNWSLITHEGDNLLSPGDDPAGNTCFLLMLAAVVRAVHHYSGLIRVTAATAGNDRRLGSSEAPPPIVSIFLGQELIGILNAMSRGGEAISAGHALVTGVSSLPVLPRDATDRNRTSPMAFTGSKFEFRMTGSSQSVSVINTVLNTAVADSLMIFADRLEAGIGVDIIIRDTLDECSAILFDGNNYSREWEEEAARRGLSAASSTVDALEGYVTAENIDLFARHGVLTENEVRSRHEIMAQDYIKTINIEAMTMLEMARREILPAAIEYSRMLFSAIDAKNRCGPNVSIQNEIESATGLQLLIEDFIERQDALDRSLERARSVEDMMGRARAFRGQVVGAMGNLRAVADQLETVVGSRYWPFPTYSDLLFRV